MDGEIIGCSISDKMLSKTKYVNHVFRQVTGFIKIGNTAESVEINTEVIILPDGGQIIPYFKGGKGRWKIVLVSQYRPAVKEKTIEGAGGRLDGESPEIALSRELEEETRIKVDPRAIQMAFREYSNPSIVSSDVYGGIIKISAKIVKNKKWAGKRSENERTRIEIFDLVEILNKRENGKIMIDLATSHLIDYVAKAVGLLVKKY